MTSKQPQSNFPAPRNDPRNAPGNAPQLPPQTDPVLDALLDEALSPQSVQGGVPAGMTDRIFAATQGGLSRRRGGVLATIGQARTWWAAAAVVTLAAFGVWFANQGSTDVNPTSVVQGIDLEEELAVLERFAAEYPRVSDVDRELNALAVQIHNSANTQMRLDEVWQMMQELEQEQDL